ncbi:MAG: hypothetical protein ACXVH2_07860 [Methanobacterium sp.]
MNTRLIKFDKHIDYWDIGFDITLTDEELSICNMDKRKHIKNCEVSLIGSIMSFNYKFLKKNLKNNETIFVRFGHIQNCVENIAASSLI